MPPSTSTAQELRSAARGSWTLLLRAYRCCSPVLCVPWLGQLHSVPCQALWLPMMGQIYFAVASSC